jgi:hypothetical protein
VVLNLIRFAASRWDVTLAIWYGAARVVFALPLAWILYHHIFFDPAVLTDINGPDWKTPDASYTVVASIVLAVGARQVIKRFLEARASAAGRRAPRTRAAR